MLHTPLSLQERVIVVIESFVAISAFGGGGMLIFVPDGRLMQMPVTMLETSPFSTFFIPGVILVLANGLFPTAVVISTLKRLDWVRFGHVATGVILVGWIAIQGVMVGFGHWLQITYGALGLVLIGFGLAAYPRISNTTSV